MSIYHCIVLDYVKFSQDFRLSRNKAKDKRFFHIWCPHVRTCLCKWTYPPSYDGFGMRTLQMYDKFIIYKNFC